MTPAQAVATLQISAGVLQLRRPGAALRLFGYPTSGLGPRLVVQVLGLRHVLQGTAELTGNRALLRTGAAVDATHAATAVLYACRSAVGRRAGRRNAAMAIGFAGAQLLAAAQVQVQVQVHNQQKQADRSPRHAADGSADPTSGPTSQPRSSVARVNGPSSPAWPQPTDPGQHVLVEYPADSGATVRLEGGAMDGATVSLASDADSYRITDTENGPLVYRPVQGPADPDGLPVLRLQSPTDDCSADGGDSACWSHLLCETCDAVLDDPAQARCGRCGRPQ